MGRNRKILAMSTGDLTKKAQSEKALAQSRIVQNPDDLDDLPADLADTKAKAEWRRVKPELKKMDIVGKLDIAILVGYCNAYSKYCEATKLLRKQPLVIELQGKDGNAAGSKENPLVNVQLKYAEQYRKFADQCGLTINSRLKWAATKQKKEEEKIETEFGAI